MAGEESLASLASPVKRSARVRPGVGRVALKARVRLQGLNALDLRTAAARALVAWEHELVEHLGGQDAVSTPERLLVGKVVMTELLIADADRRLLEMATTVTRRNKYVGLVRERQALVDSQARLLNMLGLTRRARPAKSLQEVVAEVMAEKAARQEQPEQAEAPGEAQSPHVETEPDPGPSAVAGGPDRLAWRDGAGQGARDPEPEQREGGGQRRDGSPIGDMPGVVSGADPTERPSAAAESGSPPEQLGLAAAVTDVDAVMVTPRSLAPVALEATRPEEEQPKLHGCPPEVVANEERLRDRDRAGLADPTEAADREDRNEPLVAEPEEWF